MNSRDTREEKEFLASFHDVVGKCKEHLISVRNKLGDDELEMRDLAGLANCLYLGKKESRTIDGKAAFVYSHQHNPRLYAKVRVAWDGRFESTFSTHRDLGAGRSSKPGVPVHPISLLGKKCLARTYLILESIYIGSNKVYSLQVKVKEASCQPYVEDRIDEAPIEEGHIEFAVGNHSGVHAIHSAYSPVEEEEEEGGETDECESDF